LLRIMQGQSVGLFNKVLKWRFNSDYVYHAKCGESAAYYNVGKQTVLDSLSENYGFQNLKARVERVKLPRTGCMADVVIFPFGPTLMSLLTDPEAMDQRNLLIDLKNPFARPVYGGPDGFLGDINTGSLFADFHDIHCPGERDVPAYLQFFIDKSHSDGKGKLTVEPVMYTTSLWKREFRNKPQAWRPLGYVPNMEHVAPGHKPQDKLYDYHHCLELIMSEMIEYQKLKGIEWHLLGMEGEWISVRLQIPVLFIIGDTEGHDKLAGRKVDRTSGKSRQCRYCDVTFDECDNPFSKTSLTLCDDVKKHRDLAKSGSKMEGKEGMEWLENMSYRNIKSAFDNVVFVDQRRGIHGATLAEVLHAMNLGIQEKCLECCFQMKRKNKK